VNRLLKFILIGAGGLVGLVIVVILIAIFWPQKPTHIEAHGAFDIYWYHFASIGEPGHSYPELWHKGKRLAAYPTYVSLNPEGDRLIFVNAMDGGFDERIPKGNGIYYFDTRKGKQYKLTDAKYPSFYNGEKWWDLRDRPTPNATPWFPDESFAVVSYGDGLKIPELTYKKERVLFVHLATGKVRSAADLLEVSDDEHIIFRGWSDDHLTLFFRVGEEDRTLPISAVLKK
jgi:hypothetical protein